MAAYGGSSRRPVCVEKRQATYLRGCRYRGAAARGLGETGAVKTGHMG